MPEKTGLPHNKAELIATIQEEWKLLFELINRLDETQILAPDAEGWSPKDNLAHLAEWINILLGFYMDLRRAHEVLNVPPEVTQHWDFEARNRYLYERNRQMPLESVLSELKNQYAALMERLNVMSFEELMKPQHPLDPTQKPLIVFVLRGSSEHFAEHRQRMVANLSQRAGN